MTNNPPPLTESLNKALDQAIQNQFNNLIANMIAPTYNANKNDTPISRFEHILKIILEAYGQALAVVEKDQPK